MLSDLHILNLGAGVQSTTVYLLAHEGKLHLDCAIFADTQEEPAAVYRHLDWMESLNSIPILRRTRGKLGDDLMQQVSTNSRTHFASIPAHAVGPNGQPAITRRQCSREYKADIVKRTIRYELLRLKFRQRWPRGQLTQYFGISRDEASRSLRIKDRLKEEGHSEAHFPLLDLNWTRADCLRYLKERVPHQVPRSACVFCPYNSNQRWLEMKRDPVAWERILTIDQALRTRGLVVNEGMRYTMYLHWSGEPIDTVDLNEKQLEFPGFVRECEGMCGV